MKNSTICLCLLLCFFLRCTEVYAVPAMKVVRTLVLADGTQVEAVLRGDEFLHYYQDKEGNAYAFDEVAGCYTRADLPRMEQRREMKLRFSSRCRARRMASSATRAFGDSSYPITGEHRGLVILVNFQDTDMVLSSREYDNLFNQEGYSINGMSGSVHDYFLQQSYGQFSFSFDVVGPVRVSKNIAYYGQNDSSGNDMHPEEMVAEACQLVDSEVDFRRYDWDGDGEVEQVFVVYAGYAESYGAPSYTIWPHQFQLSYNESYGDGGITLDGVKVDSYACSSELEGVSGQKIMPIGTPCHEFSHCFCLPDFYDTKGYNYGMQDWDIMDGGTYNNGGRTPAAYTSYERMFCGWLAPVELNADCAVSGMKPLTEEAEAYIIYNPAYRKEFYMIENRQSEGFDSSLPNHGMLILHVDFDSNAWSMNTVNNVWSHQRMTLFPADGKFGYVDMGGDSWPGTSQNRSFSSTTTPCATLYHANASGRCYMDISLSDISEEGNTLRFLFKNLGSSDMTDIVHDKKSAETYDLLGRKVSLGQSQHGIRVVDGRKVYFGR